MSFEGMFMFSQESCCITNSTYTFIRPTSHVTMGYAEMSLNVMPCLVICCDPISVLTCHWLLFQAGEWCEPITLRPPNEATSSTPVQYWQHHPEKLIFQSCDYEAYVSPPASFVCLCVLGMVGHRLLLGTNFRFRTT